MPASIEDPNEIEKSLLQDHGCLRFVGHPRQGKYDPFPDYTSNASGISRWPSDRNLASERSR